MSRLLVSPSAVFAVDPALFPLFFQAFGRPAGLPAKGPWSARDVARVMWGGEGPGSLVEGAAMFAALADGRAREALREGVDDARAQGHFEGGAIDRALARVEAPVELWGRMPAADLALRLVVARRDCDALEAVFERAQHRLARSLPAHVPYELAARTSVAPGAARADLVARAIEDAARREGGWAEAWEADDDGEVAIAVVRAAPCEAYVEVPAEDPSSSPAPPWPSRAVRSALAVDVVRLRPADARLSITTAHPRVVAPYAAAVGEATLGDPLAFVDRAALTLKKLQLAGAAGLAKTRMPRPITRMEVVALQVDDLRGLRTESRGPRALAAALALLKKGGYLVRATFRFTIAGAPAPVDAYVELPRRLWVSDPRFEAEVRAALSALGVLSPGAHGDDMTTLAPWVHPEWRWCEILGRKAFDALVRAGVLVRASAKETGGRVAHEATRALAGSVRAFPLSGAKDRGKHYAVAADPSEPARTVATKDLVMWRVSQPARRARLRAAMRLDAAAPIALPVGVGDVGRLRVGAGAVRFVELVRRVSAAEAPKVARAIRRAVGRDLVAVLVPEGVTLGGVLAEVPVDSASQLGAGDVSEVVARAARELNIEAELEAPRLGTRDKPIVILQETEEVWLGTVKLTLASRHFVLFLALADGKPRVGAELGKKLSPGAADLVHVVHKARSEIDARVAQSFADEGVELPEEWSAGKLIVRSGNRSFRLAVGCVVR
jgi:hypothetical protein